MSFIDLMNLVSFGGPVNEKFGESIKNHVEEIQFKLISKLKAEK